MIKRFLIIFTAIFLICFSGIGLYFYINKNFIKNQIITAINNELEAKVNVNGKIDLSLFESFPQITLKFEEVYIDDKLRKNDTLAYLKQINLTINPFSIIKKDYSIEGIKLYKGFVHLYIDENGNQNFNIVKSNTENNTEPSILNLKSVVLKEIDLKYLDKPNNIFTHSYTEKTEIKGVFEQKGFKISLNIDHFLNKSFKINETNILNGKKLNGTIKIAFNEKENCYVFDKNSIKIENNNAEITGKYCNTNNIIELNAKIKGTSLKDALNLVPKKWLTIEDFSGNGNYNLNVLMSGNIDNLKINADFELENGNLNINKEEIKLTNVNVSGNYNNLQNENGSLQLKSFSFNFLNSSFIGSLNYPNLNKTELQTELKATLNKELLNNFLDKHFNFTDGNISIKNLKLDISERENGKWKINNIDGNISLNDIEGQAIKINLPLICSGELFGTKNYLTVLNLKTNFGNNDLHFDGEIKNLLEQIINNDYSQPIGVYGKLNSKYFNLNEFIVNNNNIDSVAVADSTQIVFPLIIGKVNVEVKEFIYQKLSLKNLNISSVANGTNYQFNIAPIEVFGGSFNGILTSNIIDNTDLEININGSTKNINISQLFEAFNNFDLDELKSENIKGILTADFALTSIWNNFKHFNKDKFIMNSQILLQNGELNNYKPLMSLSKVIDVNQLSNLRFDDLSTNIIIEKGVIYLPLTEIKSNLLSLKAGGTHTFNNEIDYRLILNLKNLLAAKFKTKETNKENYVNDITGGINIFISITGTVDNPIIKYDKESVRQKIKQDFKEEKQEFKNLFKKNNKSEFEEDKTEFEKFDTEEYIEWEE